MTNSCEVCDNGSKKNCLVYSLLISYVYIKLYIKKIDATNLFVWTGSLSMLCNLFVFQSKENKKKC